MSEQFREPAKMMLKPCPFCGGEAYINYESMVDERRIYWAQILCKKCHCRSAGNWNNSYENAEKKEINAWNTRKSMERIVEQLKNTNCVDNNGYINPKVAVDIVQKEGTK